MKHAIQLISCFLLSALLCGPPVSAQETQTVQVSGTIVFVMEQTYDTVPLPNGHRLDRHTAAGNFLADSANTAPFQHVVVDAAVTALYNADGQWVRATGHGELVDKDGDVCWFWTNNRPETTHSGIIGGTGKYEECRGSGTFTLIDQLPDARQIYHYQGTLDLQSTQ